MNIPKFGYKSAFVIVTITFLSVWLIPEWFNFTLWSFILSGIVCGAVLIGSLHYIEKYPLTRKQIIMVCVGITVLVSVILSLGYYGRILM